MRILVSSGDYREVVDLEINDRRIAHRIGCIRAVESGRELGRVIRSSIHLDSQEIQDDDLWSSTEIVEELLKKGKCEE